MSHEQQQQLSHEQQQQLSHEQQQLSHEQQQQRMELLELLAQCSDHLGGGDDVDALIEGARVWLDQLKRDETELLAMPKLTPQEKSRLLGLPPLMKHCESIISLHEALTQSSAEVFQECSDLIRFCIAAPLRSGCDPKKPAFPYSAETFEFCFSISLIRADFTGIVLDESSVFSQWQYAGDKNPKMCDMDMKGLQRDSPDRPAVNLLPKVLRKDDSDSNALAVASVEWTECDAFRNLPQQRGCGVYSVSVVQTSLLNSHADTKMTDGNVLPVPDLAHGASSAAESAAESADYLVKARTPEHAGKLDEGAERAFCEAVYHVMIELERNNTKRPVSDSVLGHELEKRHVCYPYGTTKDAKQQGLKCYPEILRDDHKGRFVVSSHDRSDFTVDLVTAAKTKILKTLVPNGPSNFRDQKIAFCFFGASKKRNVNTQKPLGNVLVNLSVSICGVRHYSFCYCYFVLLLLYRILLLRL